MHADSLYPARDVTEVPAVAVDRVSKAFRLPREQVHTLKERALHPFRGQQHDVLKALDDVSFDVRRGEFFGIVGRNGSGKSTLLKCLAGIYRADAGSIHVDGRLSAFIELGVGFNPDLAARDNIVLNATMLGLGPREARGVVDDVLHFAELEEFVDLKLKNYSSGMMVRLAFAVMIQVEADILLIDEVLAVGDASFQQKCFDEFERVRAAGKTVLLVTHDMGSVRRFCDRAILIERGRVVEIGDPETVGSHYLELNFNAEARASTEARAGAAPRLVAASGEEERLGDGAAQILRAWAVDERGKRADTLKTAYPCTFFADVVFNEDVDQPQFTLEIQSSRREVVFVAATQLTAPDTGSFRAGDRARFRVHFGNVLNPDRYAITFSVASQGGAWLDRRERMMSMLVTGTLDTGAIVQLPHEIDVEQVAAEPPVRAEG